MERNTQTFNSDIDILLIVKDLPNGRMNRMRDFLEIEDKLDGDVQKARNNGWYVDLSPIIRTPEEVSMGGYYWEIKPDIKPGEVIRL